MAGIGAEQPGAILLGHGKGTPLDEGKDIAACRIYAKDNVPVNSPRRGMVP
ncbi:hypothetical protein D516_0507 [Rhodobacter sp. AKP1]|nr:hypothetical protein D516_0507 [Rhodobacter sp. AKP1]